MAIMIPPCDSTCVELSALHSLHCLFPGVGGGGKSDEDYVSFCYIPGEDSDHIYCGQIWILQMVVMKTTEEMPEAGGAIAGERDAIDNINGVEGERSDDWSF